MTETCHNPGYDNYWTCPMCYRTLDAKKGKTVTCDGCGNQVLCTLEYQPVCKSEVVTQDQDNEDDLD